MSQQGGGPPLALLEAARDVLACPRRSLTSRVSDDSSTGVEPTGRVALSHDLGYVVETPLHVPREVRTFRRPTAGNATSHHGWMSLHRTSDR
jgi:hypothetical protein